MPINFNDSETERIAKKILAFEGGLKQDRDSDSSLQAQVDDVVNTLGRAILDDKIAFFSAKDAVFLLSVLRHTFGGHQHTIHVVITEGEEMSGE